MFTLATMLMAATVVFCGTALLCDLGVFRFPLGESLAATASFFFPPAALFLGAGWRSPTARGLWLAALACTLLALTSSRLPQGAVAFDRGPLVIFLCMLFEGSLLSKLTAALGPLLLAEAFHAECLARRRPVGERFRISAFFWVLLLALVVAATAVPPRGDRAAWLLAESAACLVLASIYLCWGALALINLERPEPPTPR